ncbi:MAG: aryl-sulfate sulfotransferase [Deltaproteobacteria bacterium]|nr:aryl-sulfate sulfotransferase [Deltaproteobacteria bacterium]
MFGSEFSRFRETLSLFLVLLLFSFVLGCGGEETTESVRTGNDTGDTYHGQGDPDDSETDDDVAADDDVASDDDAADDDVAPEDFRIEVLPISAGNPLSRSIVVTTAEPMSLSARATTAGEPGYAPSFPSASEWGTRHEFLLAGLIAEKTFEVEILDADDPSRVLATTEFETSALPEHAPIMTVETYDKGAARPDRWALQSLFELGGKLPVGVNGFITLYDRLGRLRYYHEVNVDDTQPGMVVFGVTPMSDGSFVYSCDNKLYRVDRAGGNSVYIDPQLGDEILEEIHHQFYVDEASGQAAILYNERGPAYECDQTTLTQEAVGDGIARVNMSGDVLWDWSAFDHQDVLSPVVPDVAMCVLQRSSFGDGVVDWTHANSVYPTDDNTALIVSIKNLSEVVKINAFTGEIIWQLGAGGDFTWQGSEPVLERWFWHQHDAKILPNGNVLLFDNGNCRSGTCPWGPWSRALELAIDEENMTVRVVYEHRVKMALAMGNADRLEDGNTWIGSGASKLSVEATPAGDEVWSAAIDAGYQSRSLAYPALWVYPEE